jgi:uracil-DNA glycosylase family 4
MSVPAAAITEELLRFYAEAGYDEALEEEPVDRFAQGAREAAARAGARAGGTVGGGEASPLPASLPPRQSAQAALPVARTVAGTAAVPDEEQAQRARTLAREARTLDELREIVAGFDGCNLKFTAKSTVFADGMPGAALMLVGEAPGSEEDRAGLPFVGRSGQLLDRILAAIGIERATGAYIANVVPWRPPGNRDPSPLETEICRPFIERQIELAAPKVMVTLGNPSTKLLLKAQTGIMRMRGTWSTYITASGVEIPAMPTLHPAYLLRNPAHKKLAWRDFLEVKAKLRAMEGA